MNQSTFEIIKIDSKQMVDARELHSFLGVQTKFADWILRRIEEYELVDGTDYNLLKIESQYNQVLRNDYKLSLDTAKELCMVEKNEKGKLARRYFIEVELRWRETVSKMTPTQILLENCRRLVEIEQEQMAHDRRIGTLEGRVALLASDTEYATVRGMARMLGIPIDEKTAASIGKRAKKMCDAQGLHVAYVADERHGKVNSYPKKALEPVLLAFKDGKIS